MSCVIVQKPYKGGGLPDGRCSDKRRETKRETRSGACADGRFGLL